MFKFLTRDFWHHLILAFILLLSFFAFRLASYSHLLQFLIGILTAIIYVFWGIIHHYLDRDLHFKNVIEYIFIALLGVVILGGMLL